MLSYVYSLTGEICVRAVLSKHFKLFFSRTKKAVMNQAALMKGSEMTPNHPPPNPRVVINVNRSLLCAPCFHAQKAHSIGSIRTALLRAPAVSFSPSDIFPADQRSVQIENLCYLLLEHIFTAVIATYFGSVSWTQQGQQKWDLLLKKKKKSKTILKPTMITVCFLKIKLLVFLYN